MWEKIITAVISTTWNTCPLERQKHTCSDSIVQLPLSNSTGVEMASKGPTQTTSLRLSQASRTLLSYFIVITWGYRRRLVKQGLPGTRNYCPSTSVQSTQPVAAKLADSRFRRAGPTKERANSPGRSNAITNQQSALTEYVNGERKRFKVYTRPCVAPDLQTKHNRSNRSLQEKNGFPLSPL